MQVGVLFFGLQVFSFSMRLRTVSKSSCPCDRPMPATASVIGTASAAHFQTFGVIACSFQLRAMLAG
jgi:hypothetical protein